MACAYEKLEKYEEALSWFKHAVSVDLKWPDAHYGLALCSLKLKRNHDAVNHISNAVKYSIEEYKDKVRRRRIARVEKRRALQEAIEKGEASPLVDEIGKRLKIAVEGSDSDGDDDYDVDDDLYIDEATKKNNGVSTHIMYVRALCHREIDDHRVALESYAKVMKR